MSGWMHGATPRTREILAARLAGEDVDLQGGLYLLGLVGADLHALLRTADELRRQEVGDRVSYVINRNINFTNVCVKACRFCAFSRDTRSEQTYSLDVVEVVRRVLEARELGATEVCLQAGLPPEATANTYIELCRAVHEAAPDVHIHAFSPEELKFGAQRSGMSVRALLTRLQQAGLGSLPGTSAEILDDSVRRRIAPGRISVAEWVDVLRTAHGLGLPTTSTMMFGHVETRRQQVEHLLLLRELQRETGGITEFVPLSFVHEEAPLFANDPEVRSGPTGLQVARVFALSRVLLGADIPNLQASWVKEGLRLAQWLLMVGANDLGGTLMNESISTTAGARHGQLATPATLRGLAWDSGRVPVQRSTRYEVLRVYEQEAAEADALDAVSDAEARFGSYEQLSRDERFHWTRGGAR